MERCKNHGSCVLKERYNSIIINLLEICLDTLSSVDKRKIIKVDEMTKSGKLTGKVLSSLQQDNPNLQAVSRSIYDVMNNIYNERLAGCTGFHALFEDLGKGGFKYNTIYNNNNRRTHYSLHIPSQISITLKPRIY